MVLKSGLMYGGSPGLHWSRRARSLKIEPESSSPLSKHAALPETNALGAIT
jgi:hypothetical protein